MIKAYYTALNGAVSNQNHIDVISNNMANVQTEGFKKSKAEFSDLLYTNIREGEGANTNLKSGSGSKLNDVSVIFTQGAPVQTNVPTDFAIEGDGFFQIQFEEENLFTRAGGFQQTNIDGDTYITYQGGYVLNGDEEPIILENGDDIIEPGVFVFESNNDLKQVGNNMYAIENENAEYSLSENNTALRGYIESSNVELSDEIVRLIRIQRAFQLNSRVIQTADEIEQTINTLKS